MSLISAQTGIALSTTNSQISGCIKSWGMNPAPCGHLLKVSSASHWDVSPKRASRGMGDNVAATRMCQAQKYSHPPQVENPKNRNCQWCQDWVIITLSKNPFSQSLPSSIGYREAAGFADTWRWNFLPSLCFCVM